MKKPWLSKTLWVNALVAVLALAYPPASEWMLANSGTVVTLFAVLNMVLRLVSKEKISLLE